jgi:Collagen triple helix repeat (20 copies)
MAINFPNSPAVNDTYTVGSVTYTWNGTFWSTSAPATAIVASVTTSDTAPVSPNDGDLWWKSDEGKMYVYYADGDSNQWVQASPTNTGAQGTTGIQGIQGVQGISVQGIQGIQGATGTLDNGVDVSNSTTQSIPASAVYTAVTFDTENRDDNGYWTSGSIVTIPAAGWYVIWGQFAWGADTVGARRINIVKNQATSTPLATEVELPASGTTINQTITGVFYFAASDQVELYALNGSTAAILISGARLTVHRLGAGAQGIQGTIGTQGTLGTQGTQGIQGLDGAYAAQGIQGIQGVQGVQSIQGLQGIQGLAGGDGIITQNIQTGNYTLVIGDAGKHIFRSNGSGAGTYTIPSNASVAFDIGTAITFINDDPGLLTIAIDTDTLVLAGVGSLGSRTLIRYGIATATKVTSTMWFISGVGLS